MSKSQLDPHHADLLSRARQKYSLRMLQLYLRNNKSLRVSRATISRWLSKNRVTHMPHLPPDDEYHRYQTEARAFLQERRYTRVLSAWGNHIVYMREHGASLPEIQQYLRRQGVITSTKTIYRELIGAE